MSGGYDDKSVAMPVPGPMVGNIHTQVISMPITVMRCLTRPLFEWQGPMGPRGPPGPPGSSVRTNLIPSYFTVFLSCSWVEEWSMSGPHHQTTIKCLFQNKIYSVFQIDAGHHSWKKIFNFNSTFCDFLKKCLSHLKVKTAAVNECCRRLKHDTTSLQLCTWCSVVLSWSILALVSVLALSSSIQTHFTQLATAIYTA